MGEPEPNLPPPYDVRRRRIRMGLFPSLTRWLLALARWLRIRGYRWMQVAVEGSTQ
jgi:hypothetical protein